MTYLSEHFSLDEMMASESASRLGIDNSPPVGVIGNLRSTAILLEPVRKLLGAAMHINSGYRSPELNKAIGGVPTSAHCKGWAVDFICPSFGSTYKVAEAIASSGIKFDQLILEYEWVHISFDPQMRGEVLTKKSAAATYQHGLHQ